MNQQPAAPQHDAHSKADDGTVAYMDHYGDGARWMSGMIDAVLHAFDGDVALASGQAFEADCLLAPLGDEPDPNRLRDFVAGAAAAGEAVLRQANVPIVTDAPLAKGGV